VPYHLFEGVLWAAAIPPIVGNVGGRHTARLGAIWAVAQPPICGAVPCVVRPCHLSLDSTGGRHTAYAEDIKLEKLGDSQPLWKVNDAGSQQTAHLT
jgi:hypothetical protein